MNLTRTISNRISNIESADSFFSASSAGKLLMWISLALVGFSW